jgi:hypothetical protein
MAPLGRRVPYPGGGERWQRQGSAGLEGRRPIMARTASRRPAHRTTLSVWASAGGMSRRRMLVSTGSVTLTLPLAAACGASTAGDGAGSPSAGPVSISFGSKWASGPRLETINAALPMFSRQYPTITVDFHPITGDKATTIVTMFASGTPDDESDRRWQHRQSYRRKHQGPQHQVRVGHHAAAKSAPDRQGHDHDQRTDPYGERPEWRQSGTD